MPLERQTINRINHRKLKTLWLKLAALNTKAFYLALLQCYQLCGYIMAKSGTFSIAIFQIPFWQYSSNHYFAKLVPMQFLNKRLWKWLLFCTDDRPPNVFCNCNNVIQYKYVLVRREREYVCSFCKQLACWLKSPK